MELVITITNIFLLLLLVYTYYRVSTDDKVPSFSKWVIVIASLGVLAFDKIKLVLFIIGLAAVWLIKYYKKNKNDGLA